MAEKRISIDYGSISGGTDVSDTTAIESDVLAGKIFHLANGESAVGTFIPTDVEYADMGTNSNQATLTHTFGFAPDYFLFGGLGGTVTLSIFKADKTAIISSASSSWTKFTLSDDGKTITYKCDHNGSTHDRLIGIKGINIT